MYPKWFHDKNNQAYFYCHIDTYPHVYRVTPKGPKRFDIQIILIPPKLVINDFCTWINPLRTFPPNWPWPVSEGRRVQGSHDAGAEHPRQGKNCMTTGRFPRIPWL